ncbi:GNAT family N-acetyltransferase [Actinacidiphila acididurans]|uniref:GNAT family N-acetyltransferase n=1 Tax=Actinacidiphila acididurans TaxID=2784346 RepID=A0ABS2U4H1_9ACTN|nr:GNAT family protein [Actinacidiphila acididurans]MBM9509033.1 GNAT family N-acetyltransferase [Actinacidiphila acididurans]
MIRGAKIGLRARQLTDVPVLHAEFYEDVAAQARANPRPWVPIPVSSGHSPFAVQEPSDTVAQFSVVDLESGALAGMASLWGVDSHNRSAHLGLSLLSAFRGRGLGTDIVRVLCEYGFAVRGLQRLQVDTVSDNAPMIAAATRAGFAPEGTLRRAAWIYGTFADLVILGLLSEEWASSRE